MVLSPMAVSIGVAPVLGCATTTPLAETEIAEDPFALAARAHVTLAAVGEPVANRSGAGGTTMGAVRPVTCIRLPGGDLLTAAHTLPTTDLGAVRMYKDPVTGAYRVDEQNPTDEGPELIVVLDGTASAGRVTASDTLRYASAGEGSRASVPADWAVIATDTAGPLPRGARSVSRIGTPVSGERCVMVGYPMAMMDRSLFDSGSGVRQISDLKWIGAAGVVITGTIEDVGRERIDIATIGVLGTKGRGLSGGGVFVERNGQPVLVGVVVQAAKFDERIIACPLPRDVRERF